MDTSAATILLIQPRRNALAVLTRRLSDAGFDVVEAGTALDGLAKLHAGGIDLILSEIQLPGRSGIELTRLVREQAVHEYLPIMLITGKSNREGAVEGYAAGADDVIAKPFDTDVLAARLRRRLAMAGRIGALRQDNATLDARVIRRAIQIGELRDQLTAERIARRD